MILHETADRRDDASKRRVRSRRAECGVLTLETSYLIIANGYFNGSLGTYHYSNTAPSLNIRRK